MFIGVTETWLHDGVCDAEVSHSFPGYSVLRCDRAGGRQGGGVALYLREDLTGDTLASHAQVHPQRGGSVCELLIVHIHQLDTVVCLVYRPPDTRLEEFAGLLQVIDNTLSQLASPTPTIILMGDFNLPKTCISWKWSDGGILVPLVAGHRDEETAGGKQDRLQAQQLIDLSSKFCLLQEVDKPTHIVELLDLVFTNNCDLVCSTEVEDWPAFTDHRLVICHSNYNFRKNESVQEEQYLCDTGRRYSALDFHKAPWAEVKSELELINWDKMKELALTSPASALSEFHHQVLSVLEKLVPVKRKKGKGKPKIHRMRRLLWKRLAKVRRKLKTAHTIHQVTECLQSMWKLESELASDYSSSNNMEEDQAVLRIKSNPKAFFSFAKSRQKVRAKVGPFLDPALGTPSPSPDFAADALRKQYDSVFAVPRPAWSVSNFKEHFRETEEECLNNINFSPEDIEKACSELKSTSAPGPDGVPAILLTT